MSDVHVKNSKENIQRRFQNTEKQFVQLCERLQLSEVMPDSKEEDSTNVSFEKLYYSKNFRKPFMAGYQTTSQVGSRSSYEKRGDGRKRSVKTLSMGNQRTLPSSKGIQQRLKAAFPKTNQINRRNVNASTNKHREEYFNPYEKIACQPAFKSPLPMISRRAMNINDNHDDDNDEDDLLMT
mmetsp:Transcript_14039/g.22387  ORF Transcript_14039/g.22387 Transcript_14039/m.22387 type:complete len:181 (-) Transcript_14039:105-647(-)